ncbi:MAG: ABC transporter ATP-binding protein [Gracilibacteraceae bacterium]|jgi:ABC-2 type transport system ATP-binding protein|nr:ABC transporter ATP-binding protein [Gracilibacteraceae bacterium]
MTGDCIVLEKVNRFFGPAHVLKDINLRVPRGEIYGLLGPSGCGKTTAVKIIAGILEASSGEARVLGEKMPQLRLMNRIGYMAQSDALYTALSAEENLRFFGAVYGLRKSELRRRVAEVTELVNLTADLQKKTRDYSGGMKRRLSLALALLHRPPVLLLDEPTVGIDPLLRRDIWRELHRLAAGGVTILLTTHVMDEAEKCHRLAMMRAGTLLAQGSYGELLAETGAAAIEEAFLYYGEKQDES